MHSLLIKNVKLSKRQKGIYPACAGHYKIEEGMGGHITHWHLADKVSTDNCQILCRNE